MTLDEMIQSVLNSLDNESAALAQKSSVQVKAQYEGDAQFGPNLRMIAFDPEA